MLLLHDRFVSTRTRCFYYSKLLPSRSVSWHSFSLSITRRTYVRTVARSLSRACMLPMHRRKILHHRDRALLARTHMHASHTHTVTRTHTHTHAVCYVMFEFMRCFISTFSNINSERFTFSPKLNIWPNCVTAVVVAVLDLSWIKRAAEERKLLQFSRCSRCSQLPITSDTSGLHK